MSTPLTTSLTAQDTAPRRTVRPAVAILICTTVTVMEGYSLIVYGSVIPLLLTDRGLGLDTGTVGLVGSVIYVGMLAGALVAGVIGDRFGHQPVLLAGIGLFIAGFVVTGVAGDVPVLALARLLSGLGVGGAITTALTLARAHAPRNRASLVVNITMAGIPLGGALTALIGLAVLPHLGWRPMFFIGAALTLVIFAVVFLTPLELRAPSAPGREPPATGSTGPLARMFRTRGVLVAALVAAVAVPNMFTWFGLNVWLTAAMTALDYPLTSALLFSFTLTAGAVCGSLIAAPLADRFGALRTAVVTSLLTVAGLAGVVAGSRSLPLLLVCVALMGAGGHTTENLLNAAAGDLYPAPIRGTVMGWSNGLSYIGAVGPVVGGLVIGSGLGAYGVFVLFGCSACIVVVTLLALARAVRSRPAAPADGL
ncbi:MFS transporter [Streptomyces sp. NPDC004658]|uniref:MFS transporter n=1 Tax=Streptomyces sp. NPDC004658 TaxID=3154672 RepID=UPI0033A97448